MSAADGCRTHLLEVIPDITFTKTNENGKCIRIAILDPKYRTGSSLLNGVRDMHVYRDAIVDTDGQRLVTVAVALAPRVRAIPEALTEFPRDRPGIVTARPSHEANVFNRLLELTLTQLVD